MCQLGRSCARALDFRRRVLGPEHPDTLALMNNLAETLRAQGDLAGARKLLAETLDILRRVLGPEHPDTSTSAWNLFRTLQDLGEHGAAGAVLKRDLLWLLDRAPGSLSSRQCTVRERVAEAVKKNAHGAVRFAKRRRSAFAVEKAEPGLTIDKMPHFVEN
jgi:hypothetical protein